MFKLLEIIPLFGSGSQAETSEVGGIFCLVIVAVFVFLGFALYDKLAKESAIDRAIENKERKAPWQTLAATNRLVFGPSDFYRVGPQVTGYYRGYRLELFTHDVYRGRGSQLCTRLELARPEVATNFPIPKRNQSGELVTCVHGEEVNLQDALNHLESIVSKKSVPGELKIAGYKLGIYFQRSGIVEDINLLQSLFDHLSNILDYYYAVVEMGGEVVPTLKAMAAQRQHVVFVMPILQGITEQTNQLRPIAQNLLCPHCFVGFSGHQLALSWWSSVTYYGCRNCSQSREFLPHPRHVIAVLNTAWTELHHRQADTLRVNWLQRRSLFDFDRIEIIQASDEEVERFAVQVGNDTDSFRQPRYKQMKCTVSPECRLSENTLRILRRTFGTVEATQVSYE